jgi:hypothetical protein
MPGNQKTRPSSRDQTAERSNSGHGRADEVGRSGIYPASAPDAPADAEIRTVQELVKHRGARPKPFKRAV